MSAVVVALLAVSLKGALVAALVGLVVAVGGRRLPPALRHGLWLLAFVRLLLPATLPSPASLLSLSRTGGGFLPGLDPDRLAGAVASAVESGAAGAAGAPSAPAWPVVAATVWLAVFAGLLLRQAIAWHRAGRRLRSAAPVVDGRALRLLDEARRSLGVRREVGLVESGRVGVPALVGGALPRIVLPRGLLAALDDGGLRHVLLHELAHLRRWDGAVRLVARLVTAVHWFNPLAWYALSRLDAECEMACDAMALSRLPTSGRGAYGRTLIDVAARPRPERELVGPPVLALFRRHNLKRRIVMIAHYRPTSLARALAYALLFAAVAAVTLTDAPVTADPRAAMSADQGPAVDPAQKEQSKETMTRVRNAGTALFSWVTDAAAGQTWPESESDGEEATPRVDWSRCPRISYDELAKLLVPKYIPELPATDAWGHPLEFCLDRTPAPSDRYLAGIRSPGRDGSFEGETYLAGPFPVSDFDRDLVWIDGYYVTWPSAKAKTD